jgi:hypothetical protein
VSKDDVIAYAAEWLLENPSVAQLFNNLLAFRGIRRFITTRTLHWFLCSARSIQSIPPHTATLVEKQNRTNNSSRGHVKGKQPIRMGGWLNCLRRTFCDEGDGTSVSVNRKFPKPNDWIRILEMSDTVAALFNWVTCMGWLRTYRTFHRFLPISVLVTQIQVSQVTLFCPEIFKHTVSLKWINY